MTQGVKTNLANLLTVIPKTTNLATDSSGVIYDTTIPDTDLNGQASLPYGGYLGVGFLSKFDYDFYSPAPARSEIPINIRKGFAMTSLVQRFKHI